MTEKIEARTVRLVRPDGSHIRMATSIIIDGHSIDFTEKLTKKEIARYLESRKAQLSRPYQAGCATLGSRQ